jgi:chitinase
MPRQKKHGGQIIEVDRSVLSKLRLLIVVWLGASSALLASAAARRPVVAAYVFPTNSLIQPGDIAARKLTRINYAFADLQGGRIVNGFANDDKNLATLVALKQKNPSLTVLISAGGWGRSGGFSDIALTRQSRAVFIASVADYVSRHDLDGLDIDWEYPGIREVKNNFRPEDRQNYTLLLRELRQSFNKLEKQLHRRLYLTVAAGAFSNFLAHTEMNKVARIVDTVNLMAYDYYDSDDATTGHHAPLFTNPADPKRISVDRSVREFEQAGVPASKIVLGVPFYNHAWSRVPAAGNGLFQPGKPLSDERSSAAPEALMKKGFIRFWDPIASAPYLYNPKTKVFVSYDDPRSLAAKCRYVLHHKLRGMMFWDYESDSTRALLNAVDARLLFRPKMNATSFRLCAWKKAQRRGTVGQCLKARINRHPSTRPAKSMLIHRQL